ncbi:MAG: hypothetical protein GX957_15895 [Clostridiaceae bacterium]|nr:hypothetical protein [Clostridiaceae bacterium]
MEHLSGTGINIPDIGKEYVFGDDAFNTMRLQGTDGFYAMYLDSSDHGSAFPICDLKEMTYYCLEQRQWMPDNEETTNMYLKSSGECALQPGRSLAVKWLAPEAGTYYVDAYFYGGTRDTTIENDDGIAYGVYKGVERLFYLNITSAFWISRQEAEENSNYHMIKTIKLEKGEALYFTADPKKVIKSSDLPAFRISIKTSNRSIDFTSGMMSFEGCNKEDVIAYPAVKEYPQYDVKYIVRVNGKEVGVYSDKNSWNKSVNFASFEMREGKTVMVEVTPLFGYNEYKILPDKYGIISSRNCNSISFKLSDCKAKLSFVFDENYKNTTLHLFANPIDDEAPTESTDRVLYFGPGYHSLQKPIEPESGQIVYIANGAVVSGTVRIFRKDNVIVTGSGMIVRDESSLSGFRAIRVIDSTNIKISGITANVNMKNEWTTEIRRSSNVLIDNYKVISPEWASTDAVDIINSQKVYVTDSFLRSTDDTVTLKGLEWEGTGELPAQLEHIYITGCILWNECNSAMVVGEESMAKYYRNIYFRDIDVIFSYDDIYHHENLYERAVISIIPCHGSTFEQIYWENIKVNQCERLVCFAFVNEFYKKPIGDLCQKIPGYIKNVTIKNVISNSNSTGLYANQIYLKGWDANKNISDINFENVVIRGEKLNADSPFIVKNTYVSNIVFK